VGDRAPGPRYFRLEHRWLMLWVAKGEGREQDERRAPLKVPWVTKGKLRESQYRCDSCPRSASTNYGLRLLGFVI
jgi:hypothetical protein